MKRSCCGGRRPAGSSGRKVAQGSSRLSAQRPCREKKHSSHVTFLALLVARGGAATTAAGTVQRPFVHDCVTRPAAIKAAPSGLCKGYPTAKSANRRVSAKTPQ